jgi:hypothetical protein
MNKVYETAEAAFEDLLDDGMSMMADSFDTELIIGSRIWFNWSLTQT